MHARHGAYNHTRSSYPGRDPSKPSLTVAKLHVLAHCSESPAAALLKTYLSPACRLPAKLCIRARALGLMAIGDGTARARSNAGRSRPRQLRHRRRARHPKSSVSWCTTSPMADPTRLPFLNAIASPECGELQHMTDKRVPPSTGGRPDDPALRANLRDGHAPSDDPHPHDNDEYRRRNSR